MLRWLMSRWIAICGIIFLAACQDLEAPFVGVERDRSTVSSVQSPVPMNKSAPARRSGGMFGREATSVWEQVAGNDQEFSVPSPDGRSVLRARWIRADREGVDEPVVINISGAIGRYEFELVPGVGTEVLWKRTSNALLITTSSAGLNGIYSLIVIAPFNGRLQQRDLTRLVEERFGSPVRCDWPEPPNVAAIAWLPNGNVLAAAEIVHHSVCDSYGTFRAYEIDPQRMRIVREFDQLEAKRRFGRLLGWEIVDAPDHCVLRPDLCTVDYIRQHAGAAH